MKRLVLNYSFFSLRQIDTTCSSPANFFWYCKLWIMSSRNKRRRTVAFYHSGLPCLMTRNLHQDAIKFLDKLEITKQNQSQNRKRHKRTRVNWKGHSLCSSGSCISDWQHLLQQLRTIREEYKYIHTGLGCAVVFVIASFSLCISTMAFWIIRVRSGLEHLGHLLTKL